MWKRDRFLSGFLGLYPVFPPVPHTHLPLYKWLLTEGQTSEGWRNLPTNNALSEIGERWISNFTSYLKDLQKAYSRRLHSVIFLRLYPSTLCSSNSVRENQKIKQSNYRSGEPRRVPVGWGSQISRQSTHEAVMLSALSTGRLYSPASTPGTHFCQRLSQPQCHIWAGRIMSINNSDFSRTRYPPSGSAVPQLTAPPRAS